MVPKNEWICFPNWLWPAGRGSMSWAEPELKKAIQLNLIFGIALAGEEKGQNCGS